MIVSIPALLVSLFFMIRMLLIVMGLYKTPVIRSFEKYGGEENTHYPLFHLLVWLIVMSISLWFLVSFLLDLSYMQLLGVVMLIVAPYVYNWLLRFAKRHPDVFSAYPQWYRRLRGRTSRYERRHIAYMWLHLSWGMRWSYNTHDRAFLQWADLVILATDV